MFQLLYTVVHWLLSGLQIVLVPLCFVSAWAILALTIWNIVAGLRDGVARARQMHTIPCAECRFFTNSHQLKCTVHPDRALSEQAIGCLDYEPDASIYSMTPSQR